MMLEVGQQVRVLEPFTYSFPDVYEITEIVEHSDGQVVYILGEHGGFDAIFLEVVV
jgi:hypothetical protein